MTKRKRSIGSVKKELVTKSREAALTAIKVFNDPLITFKGETFIGPWGLTPMICDPDDLPSESRSFYCSRFFVIINHQVFSFIIWNNIFS